MTVQDYKNAAVKLNDFCKYVYAVKNAEFIKMMEQTKKESQIMIDKMNNDLWQAIVKYKN